MIGLISFLAPLILGQAPVVPATEVSLLFAGDAMQHKAQIQSAKQGEAYDYSPCFADITHEIAAADYAVVNLESPIGGQPYTGYPCFLRRTNFQSHYKTQDSTFSLPPTITVSTVIPEGLYAHCIYSTLSEQTI